MHPHGVDDIDDYLYSKEISQKGILFPVRKITRTSSKGPCSMSPQIIAETRNILKCLLCKSELSNPFILSCSHRFCRSCLKEYDRNYTSQKCPKCRRNLLQQSRKDSSLPLIIQAFQQIVVQSGTWHQQAQYLSLKRGPPQSLRVEVRQAFKRIRREIQLPVEPKNLKDVEATDGDESNDQSIQDMQLQKEKAINFYKDELSPQNMQIFLQLLKGKTLKEPQKRGKGSQGEKIQISAKAPIIVGRKGTGLKKQLIEESIVLSKQQKSQTNKEQSFLGSQLSGMSRQPAKSKEKAHSQRRDDNIQTKYVQNISKETTEEQIKHVQPKQSCNFQKKSKYCKIKLKNLPNHVQLELKFTLIVCTVDTKARFFCSLLAGELGVSADQVRLFRIHRGELWPITEFQSIEGLFLHENQLCHQSHRSLATSLQAMLALAIEDPYPEGELMGNSQLYGTIYYQIDFPKSV